MSLFRFWDFHNKCYIESSTLDQLSVTAIKTGQSCQKKLFLTLTQPKPPKSYYLTIGSCFHAVIEYYFREKVKTGNDLTWEQLYSTFLKEWDKAKPGTVWDKITEEQGKRKCQNLIMIYIKDCKTLIPIGNEGIERFVMMTARQGDEKIRVTGKIDLIVKGGYAIDHKSGQLRNPDEEIQAQLYPLALKAIGIDCKGFEFRVVDGALVKSHKVEFDINKANKALADAFAFKKNFAEGVFLENRRSCAFCDYKVACNSMGMENKNIP